MYAHIGPSHPAPQFGKLQYLVASTVWINTTAATTTTVAMAAGAPAGVLLAIYGDTGRGGGRAYKQVW